MRQMSLPLADVKPKKNTFASRRHGRSVGVTTAPVGLRVMPPIKSWHRVVPPWCGGVDPSWKPLSPAGEMEKCQNIDGFPVVPIISHKPRRKDRKDAKANQDALTRNYRDHKRQAMVDPAMRERIAAAEAERMKRERQQKEADRKELERKRRLGVIN